MKVELNQKQKDHLNRVIKNNSVYQFLSVKDDMQFEVGDVIIKYTKRTWGEDKDKWKAQPISSDNAMPQRYVIIHKDEYGLLYFKKLKVSDGSLGDDIYALTDFEYSHTKFEVDPEYAEKQLLEANFDIKELHKAFLQQRKIVTKMNRKIGVKPKTLKEFNNFFGSLKPGDHFYVSSDYTGRYHQEYEAISISTKPTYQLDIEQDYRWRRAKEYWRDNLSAYVNDLNVVCIRYKAVPNKGQTWTPQEEDAYSFSMTHRDSVLYKTLPASEDKK